MEITRLSVERLGLFLSLDSECQNEKRYPSLFFLLPSLAIIQASHPPGSLTNAFQIVPTYFLLFLSPPGRDKGITQSLRISGPWLHSDILSCDNLVIFRLLAIFETTRLVYYIYFQVVCRYYCSITSKKSRKLFGKVFDYYRILHLIFYWMIRKLKQRINLFLKPMIHSYANFMYWSRKQTLKVK
jgi:hypothetical protein